jgi:protein-tyrosine phosphatase
MADVSVHELPGAWNFRDVADGVTALRPGRLFRSSELSRLTDDGRAALSRLEITDVADLRTRQEIARRGAGLVPDEIVIHLLPIPDLSDEGTDGPHAGEAPHEHAIRGMQNGEGDEPDGSGESPAEAAARLMTDEYRELPTRNGAQRAVQHIVALLGTGRPVLTHCLAGKDRTGFMVATILEAIGLGRDVIVADYLRSNEWVAPMREWVTQMIEQETDTELTPEMVRFNEARLADEFLGVRVDYLDAARQTIDETFGSLDVYLRDAGVTAADIDRMRSALLV